MSVVERVRECVADLEIDEARIVSVEGSEYVFTEALGTSRREEVFVDLDELFLRKMTLRTVLLEWRERVRRGREKRGYEPRSPCTTP